MWWWEISYISTSFYKESLHLKIPNSISFTPNLVQHMATFSIARQVRVMGSHEWSPWWGCPIGGTVTLKRRRHGFLELEKLECDLSDCFFCAGVAPFYRIQSQRFKVRHFLETCVVWHFSAYCSHKIHECSGRTTQWCTAIARKLILPTILDTCLMDMSRRLREWTTVFHWNAAKKFGHLPNAQIMPRLPVVISPT
jgi:hypothetical protein